MTCFSSSYDDARACFLRDAQAAGARLDAWSLDAVGPDAQRLTTDIAWLGDPQPRRALLHISGVHGVEGFVGSPIQLRLLRQPPRLAPSDALILIHAVNPYGMAWLRRANENNVDLNRNFLDPGRAYEGAPACYHRLARVLHPQRPPSRLDASFYLQGIWQIARHGYYHTKQAIVQGQYEYPQGLFFGGHRLEPSSRLLLDWLRQHLQGVERVISIDVHSGLGSFGQDVLLVSAHTSGDKVTLLRRHFGDRVATADARGVAYPTTGGLFDALPRSVAQADWTCMVQEFGTFGTVRMLKALRDENYWHIRAQVRQLEHPAKQRILQVFCPADSQWRKQVLMRGQQLAEQVAAAFFV